MENTNKGTLQTCLSKAWGGLEMAAYEIALKMKANGHTVTTVCLPDSPLYNRLKQSELDVVPLNRKNRYFSPQTILVLRRMLQSGRYSSVLIELMNELWQVVPAMTGMRDIRLVGISHTFLGVTKRDHLHRWLYGRMDCVIALTEIHKQNLLECLPVGPEIVRVLPNSVNLTKFNPNRRDETWRAQYVKGPQQLLIGVVSRLDLGKGVMEVVHVADLLRKAGVAFKIVIAGSETMGESGAQAALEKEIADRGLQDLVLLIGHHSNIEMIIASLDVLLMPSPKETFGRVLIEAMASEVAIVASAGGSVPSIIENAKTGLLAPALSAEGMAQGIMQYYRNPGMRKRFAQNGLSAALEYYDERKVDQKLYKILGLQ